MTKKDKWKAFGKNTGNAFKNFGQAIATTAKVVIGNEKNEVDENGDSKLGKAWKKTGKGFGEAGSSLGTAAAGTFQEDTDEGIEKEGAIDAEVEKKEEKNQY